MLVKSDGYHWNVIHNARDYSGYCSFHISLSKAFWRLPFYYFLFLAETFTMCVNVFYITRNEISVRSDKKEKFPHRPPL